MPHTAATTQVYISNSVNDIKQPCDLMGYNLISVYSIEQCENENRKRLGKEGGESSNTM